MGVQILRDTLITSCLKNNQLSCGAILFADYVIGLGMRMPFKLIPRHHVRTSDNTLDQVHSIFVRLALIWNR